MSNGTLLMGTKWNEFWAWINPGAEANRISQENLEFQQEVHDYERRLQTHIFNREDTALQRRVEDAEKAGLSPITQAGGPGARAGAAIPLTTPQRSHRGPEARMAQRNQMIGAAMTMANIAKTRAEADLLGARAQRERQTVTFESKNFGFQLEKAAMENSYLQQTLVRRIEATRLQTEISAATAARTREQAALIGVDAFVAEQLQDYLIEQGNIGRGSKYYPSPRILEYQAQQFALEISRIDKNLWKKLRESLIAGRYVGMGLQAIQGMRGLAPAMR